MQVTYQIVRVSPQKVQTTATLPDGKQVDATIDSLEIEMVPISHPAAGTVKLAFIGEEMAEANRTFRTGNTITVPWSELTRTAE